MRSYQQAFGVGESKDFIIDAKFFFLFEALSAVTVQFWKGGAPSDDLALDVLAGFKCRPLNGFDRITITSSAAQTIKFFVAKGEGDYDRLLGSIQLIGAVDLSAATLAALENLTDYATYTNSFRSVAAAAANTAETIFTAAVNTNGAIVHSAQLAGTTATSMSLFALLAKATAPANISDGDAILSNDFIVPSGTNWVGSASLKKPVKIPAGKGLYYINSIAELANTSNRSVLYTLL